MPDITYKEAAHLFRRMGFNAPPEEIQALVGTNRDKAVNRLLDYQTTDNALLEARLRRDFEFLLAKSADGLNDQNFNDSEIRQWWIARMLHTARPFEEKMTLFWHNFFATSLDKVPAVHMYAQNLGLRRQALARFDDLLLAAAQGPAMLIWLDGISSTRDNPNENFGRELQELFSMGTHDVVTGEPNYTEGDVKEVARAFTGWRFRKAADPSPFAYEWFLDENQADLRGKTIYGQSGNFSGQDVITLVAARRATGRYLVKRLFEFFVYTLDTDSSADRATVEKFADVYFANNHSIKELVRAILTSAEFFSNRAYFGLVKNPAEFVIGSMRMLKADFAFGMAANRNGAIEKALRGMGMDLFSPPSVFGWKLNLGFVTNDAMLERYNFADYLQHGGRTNSADAGLIPSPTSITRAFKPTAKKAMNQIMASFTQLDLAPDLVRRLQTYLVTNAQGQPTTWDVNDRFNNLIKILSMYRLIMCLPEFQLN
ncbi:MAG TPA: DUF1800 domain-containing protein [Blastocatellia bacterium]|nr:DUF1800 domain-containing protein [Blastocatellia bacterium]